MMYIPLLWAKSSANCACEGCVYRGKVERPHTRSSQCSVPLHTRKAWRVWREAKYALVECPRLLVPSSPFCWVQGIDIKTSLILNIFEVMKILNITKLSFLPESSFALDTSVQRNLQKKTKVGTSAHLKLLSPGGLQVQRAKTVHGRQVPDQRVLFYKRSKHKAFQLVLDIE